ncbi:putative myotilin [Scophthalmus maximus]|uniref:Putative myotilin n=1 Tax=Scophthalmus maximus TaxID=52904 RepID=A0A2U9C7U2_SCOMX|nr:putative myotilin [Scophthalmus maximus]
MECRLRGTPPLQVMWYREDEKILDSDDFRILRKKASSASVPEELCTLVITEAFPEDSGLFKCVALNSFGTASCSAILEVYNDLEEQLEIEALRQQEAVFQQETPPPGQSGGDDDDDFPPPLPDSVNLPPPEWPESPFEDNVPAAEFPAPQPSIHSCERPFCRSEDESAPCSEGQRSPEVVVRACTPSPPPPPSPSPSPPPPAQEKDKATTPKLIFKRNSDPPNSTLNISFVLSLTFSKYRQSSLPQSSQSGGDNMNLSDLPTFKPSTFPPSAFNYARPRHFIQSQPSFQAPSYESVLREAQENQNNSQQNLASSQNSLGVMETQSQAKIHVPSATGLGSATLPANQDNMSAPAAFLCSVLPSSSPFCSSKLSPNSNLPRPSISPSRSPLSPPSPLLPTRTNTPNSQNRVPPAVVSLPASYKGTPNILPKPILKKAVPPRPSSSRSTDDDIQGSKDALIQDLEKKLRSKEARRTNSQKLSYEERMARRLLGPDNATYMSDQDNLSDSQLDQPESPEGRHTGGLWGKHHSGTDGRGNEGSAIQEKCYAPRFLQIPPDLTVEEGRFCRIDFKVGGLPTPDVCWYLDGKAIRPDDYHKMLVCEKAMHSFIIEIVTVHHAGVYECVARNRAGESRFSMRLDVIAQEVLRPPTFVQKMLNSRALEGDTVRLECKVEASPPPQLFWKKDKDMLRIDPSRMSLYQDGSGRQCLLMERVMKSDAGWYTLSAINEAGMSTCNARLDVGTGNSLQYEAVDLFSLPKGYCMITKAQRWRAENLKVSSEFKVLNLNITITLCCVPLYSEVGKKDI